MTQHQEISEERPLAQSIKRGVVGKCPRCGEASMFDGLTSTVDTCPACGLELFHHRADDGPPFFSMFFVAPFVTALMIIYEIMVDPPMWHHVVIGVVVSVILCIGLIRPIKGAFIGIQWAKGLHGFGKGTQDQ